jgi:hypothetical protein
MMLNRSKASMGPAQSQSDHEAAVVHSHPLPHGDEPVLIANPKARLFDQVREVLRFHHYALRTEEVYLQWIKRYLGPLTPTLSPSEGAREKRRRPLAPALATAPEHYCSWQVRGRPTTISGHGLVPIRGCRPLSFH